MTKIPPRLPASQALPEERYRGGAVRPANPAQPAGGPTDRQPDTSGQEQPPAEEQKQGDLKEALATLRSRGEIARAMLNIRLQDPTQGTGADEPNGTNSVTRVNKGKPPSR